MLSIKNLPKKYQVQERYLRDIDFCFRRNEKVDFELSRISMGHCVIKTNSRYLFFRFEKDKLFFLYDKSKLLADHEEDNPEKSLIGDSLPDTYLHLALTYHFEGLRPEATYSYLKLFVRHLLKTISKDKLIEVVKEYARLFVSLREGLRVFYNVFVRLTMPKEAGLLLMEIVKISPSSGMSGINGDAYLLMGKYKEARECFENGDSFRDKIDYYWAKGLENWKNKKKCSEAFKEALNLVGEGTPLEDLMMYLLNAVRRGDKIISSEEQCSLLNKWIYKEELELKKPREEEKKAELKKPAEEKAEYVVWDIRGKKPVFKKAVEDLKNRNKKGSLDIFVDEDGVVYFGGEKVNELKKTQILYDFLLYFLKNKGIGGTYKNLFCEVWSIGKQKKFKPDFELTKSQKGNVIRMKNRLNSLLKGYGVKEIKYEYNKYRLDEDSIFFIIEKSIG